MKSIYKKKKQKSYINIRAGKKKLKTSKILKNVQIKSLNYKRQIDKNKKQLKNQKKIS